MTRRPETIHFLCTLLRTRIGAATFPITLVPIALLVGTTSNAQAGSPFSERTHQQRAPIELRTNQLRHVSSVVRAWQAERVRLARRICSAHVITPAVARAIRQSEERETVLAGLGLTSTHVDALRRRRLLGPLISSDWFRKKTTLTRRQRIMQARNANARAFVLFDRLRARTGRPKSELLTPYKRMIGRWLRTVDAQPWRFFEEHLPALDLHLILRASDDWMIPQLATTDQFEALSLVDYVRHEVPVEDQRSHTILDDVTSAISDHWFNLQSVRDWLIYVGSLHASYPDQLTNALGEFIEAQRIARQLQLGFQVYFQPEHDWYLSNEPGAPSFDLGIRRLADDAITARIEVKRRHAQWRNQNDLDHPVKFAIEKARGSIATHGTRTKRLLTVQIGWNWNGDNWVAGDRHFLLSPRGTVLHQADGQSHVQQDDLFTRTASKLANFADHSLLDQITVTDYDGRAIVVFGRHDEQWIAHKPNVDLERSALEAATAAD